MVLSRPPETIAVADSETGPASGTTAKVSALMFPVKVTVAVGMTEMYLALPSPLMVAVVGSSALSSEPGGPAGVGRPGGGMYGSICSQSCGSLHAPEPAGNQTYVLPLTSPPLRNAVPVGLRA